MKRVFTWLNNSLEEFLMGAGLIMMTAIMGIQVVFDMHLACLCHGRKRSQDIFLFGKDF